MTTTPMIRALTEYYDRMGILSTNFRCPHLAKCQGRLRSAPTCAVGSMKEARAKIAGKFVQAKSASVCAGYEDARTLGIPRLMIVSADPGSMVYPGRNFVAAEDRTPESVRRIRSGINLKPVKTGLWQHRLACRVFEEFGPDIDISVNSMRYWAHVNAVKCCMNKPKNELASRILFENCRGYLRGEIEILSPDVIVSQGREAMEGVGDVFSVPFETGREQVVALPDGKQVLWLPTHHPNSGKHFHGQRNGPTWGPDWKRFAERVREFMSGRDS